MKKRYPKPSAPQKNGRFSVLCQRARFIALAATVASTAVILSISAFDVVDDALALTKHDTDQRTVSVSELSELPGALKKSGLIKYPGIFSLYISFSGKELKRGTAAVSPDMDYHALLSAFTDKPPAVTVRITIPKTASVSEIIDIFVNHGIGSRAGFTEAINEYPFDYDFISSIPQSDSAPYRLEGYLYPDTYDFYTGRSESYYINKLLERFDKVAREVMPLCEKQGIALHDALTVASLIECSAGFSSGYERMSSVINNRLKNDSPLEIPASSIYGATTRGELFTGIPTEADMTLDSPYNMFMNKGLPPSPICNPSKEALLCAIYPESSKYFYFTTLPSGRVLFAKTEREHHENLTLNRFDQD